MNIATPAENHQGFTPFLLHYAAVADCLDDFRQPALLQLASTSQCHLPWLQTNRTAQAADMHTNCKGSASPAEHSCMQRQFPPHLYSCPDRFCHQWVHQEVPKVFTAEHNTRCSYWYVGELDLLLEEYG